jgi:propionate CoA-transferase
VLTIVAEGRNRKFVDAVTEISFNGELAARKGQSVRYVTERAVFELTTEGLELIEVAPGIDVERDVLAHMDLKPAVSVSLAVMDPRLFAPEPMGLAAGFAGAGS